MKKIIFILLFVFLVPFVSSSASIEIKWNIYNINIDIVDGFFIFYSYDKDFRPPNIMNKNLCNVEPNCIFVQRTSQTKTDYSYTIENLELREVYIWIYHSSTENNLLGIPVRFSTSRNYVRSPLKFPTTIYWQVSEITLLPLRGFFIFYSTEKDFRPNKFMSVSACLSMNHDFLNLDFKAVCDFVPLNNKQTNYSYTFENISGGEYYVSIYPTGFYMLGRELIYSTKESSLEQPKQSLIWPVDINNIVITSCYGWRKINDANNWHDGIDLRGIDENGNLINVLAVADGTVNATCVDTLRYNNRSECNTLGTKCDCRGTYINLFHEELGTYSQYNHLSELKVKKGDKVKQGDIIAIAGNTGISSAAHLDFKYYFDEKMRSRTSKPEGNPLCYLPPLPIEEEYHTNLVDYFASNAQSCTWGRISTIRRGGDGFGGITKCP